MAAAEDPLVAAQDPIATAREPMVVGQDNIQGKIDWWQLVMFLLALLCFTGAAVLWTHAS